ncbi:MAG: hypothetical protein AB1742_13710, partial [bacterium]
MYFRTFFVTMDCGGRQAVLGVRRVIAAFTPARSAGKKAVFALQPAQLLAGLPAAPACAEHGRQAGGAGTALADMCSFFGASQAAPGGIHLPPANP